MVLSIIYPPFFGCKEIPMKSRTKKISQLKKKGNEIKKVYISTTPLSNLYNSPTLARRLHCSVRLQG